LPVFLLTSSQNSSAEKIVWEKNTTITPKNREPYTYNTSTYMGWVLANTWENPKKYLNIFKMIKSNLRLKNTQYWVFFSLYFFVI
jgi:hypothetical protein